MKYYQAIKNLFFDKFFHAIIQLKQIHPVRFNLLLILLLIVYFTALFFLYFRNKQFIYKSLHKSDSTLRNTTYFISAIAPIIILCSYYLTELNFGQATPYTIKENSHISNQKNYFGIDISHYNGEINWNELNKSNHTIRFIFCRATMGADGKDLLFKKNFRRAKNNNYIRGAYHYYRPDEDPKKQFNNFAETVILKDGDFIPVLDIEQAGSISKKKLQEGVLLWLKLAENHYGVKPLVYSGSWFYKNYLINDLENYPLWIANYSGSHKISDIDWEFHQFSDQMKVKGIYSNVDGNEFSGTHKDLKKLIIE